MPTPFAFRDRVLERRYQNFSVSSCADRVYPIMCYALCPILLVIRLSYLVYSAWYGTGDMITTAIRLSLVMMVVFLVSKNWSPASNYGRGLAILWITRTAFIIAIQHQVAGAPAELQYMATHVVCICTGGWFFYSFSEYLLFALSMSFVRPLRLSLCSTAGESVLDVTYRHTLILALGVSIAWTIHADQRRDWLRSRTHADQVVHPRRPKTSGRDPTSKSAASSAAETGADYLDSVGFGTGCLVSATDAAEIHEQALQVCGTDKRMALPCQHNNIVRSGISNHFVSI